jgi:hypothetical protein
MAIIQVGGAGSIVFNVPQKIGDPTGQGLNSNQVINEILSSTKFNLLANGERALLSRLFGVGIGDAIGNEKLSKQNKDINSNPFTINDLNSVLPDAIPDGNGGFLKTAQWGGYMSSSLTGMPVMCRLKFVGTSYRALDGTTVTIPDIIFETVLISLKQTKNIKKTNIWGRKKHGSVKESMGQGDWIVDIRAIVTKSAPLNDQIFGGNQDGTYPIDNMEALRILIESDIAIKVECWYLNKIAGINYLVIDDGVDISQIEGEYEIQRITLPCISDNPLIIKIQENL